MNLKIERAKRTVLGRSLCRLLGDNAGGVMMEYVIIGVMVAAAAVVGITLFGRQIVSGFNVMINAMVGNRDAAETTATSNQAQATADATEAERSRSTIAPASEE